MMVTVGRVVSAPAGPLAGPLATPRPVTIGAMVPPAAVKLTVALTVVVVVGVNRTVTVVLAPTPLTENGLPDLIVNGAATETAPETVPPPVFVTVKVRSAKVPRFTSPNVTVPVGLTAKSGRATALATIEQALSLPAVSTAVTAT